MNCVETKVNYRKSSGLVIMFSGHSIKVCGDKNKYLTGYFRGWMSLLRLEMLTYSMPTKTIGINIFNISFNKQEL